ncbi:unnamed protein product [Polarella glacialis]|uniref:Uncharacterized protein n=1 Tax=Polarella glacialis TaxID=89957 RepID=A0A813LMR3_POLGL|nr:unnamed protein product [Polarella glacialis]
MPAARSQGGVSQFDDPSDVDILCAEFLSQVRLRTRDGYDEALRLSETILAIEPENRMVKEYQVVIRKFLKTMGERVAEAISADRDPNRTPSEVSTESERGESEEEEETFEDHVSEVASEPFSPR